MEDKKAEAVVVVPGKVRLVLRKVITKKRRKNDNNNHDTNVADLFGADLVGSSKNQGAQEQQQDDDDVLGGTKELLVIPVAANKSKFITSSSSSSNADALAAQALTTEAATANGTTPFADAGRNNTNHKNAIPLASSSSSSSIQMQQQQQQQDDADDNNNNNNNKDRAVYQKEMELLPQELTEADDAYDRVPIANFGAAVLRGMGWQGEETTTTTTTGSSKKDDLPALPRPHRLGLGAVPKPIEEITHRRLRPDEYDTRNKQRAQHQEFLVQHDKKQKADPQQTLQDGSVVYLIGVDGDDGDDTNGNGASFAGRRRAQIVKLRGVPGLNKIQIRYEGDHNETIVSKSIIDRLVTRQELIQRPFLEPPPVPIAMSLLPQPEVPSSVTNDGDRKRPSSKRQKTSGSEPTLSARTMHSDDERQQSWMIPHIRVRVITKKLGKSYYKAKCVVVDVTRKGATLQMSDGTILDRVPMRYVETALPKEGGCCIVVGGQQKQYWHTKGRLLERNRHSAIIQESENGTALTVPLDDLAEWCGPTEETNF